MKQKTLKTNSISGLLNSELSGLVISNLLTIILIILYRESFLTSLWIYWGQSILIGISSCVKIIRTPHFQVDNQADINPNTAAGKTTLVAFLFIFIIVFHAVYAVFLGIVLPLIVKTFSYHLMPVATGIIVFAVYYFIDIISSRKTETQVEPRQESFVYGFFFQILPIHITILVAVMVFLTTYLSGNEFFANMAVLIIFQILKTLAEVVTWLYRQKS